MNYNLNLLSAIGISVFTFSTVLAQNVTELQSSKELTSFASRMEVRNLRGIRDFSVEKGTSSTGGGGARILKSDPYPNQEKLRAAIEIVKNRIDSSQLPHEFKLVVIAEISFLMSNEKIRSLPALVDFQKTSAGYPQPEDSLHFLSFAGISEKTPHSPITFSSIEHQRMDELQVAASVLHEVLHNVLSIELSNDEEFVKDLHEAIISNTVTKHLNFAIKEGAYLKNLGKNLKLDQFIAMMGIGDLIEEINRQKIIGYQYRYYKSNLQNFPKYEEYVERRATAWTKILKEIEKSDLRKYSVYGFAKLILHFTEKVAMDGNESYLIEALEKKWHITFRDRLLQLNPYSVSFPEFFSNYYSSFGCTEYNDWLLGFRTNMCTKRMTIQEHLTNPDLVEKTVGER